jgi:hypothetical protein
VPFARVSQEQKQVGELKTIDSAYLRQGLCTRDYASKNTPMTLQSPAPWDCHPNRQAVTMSAPGVCRFTTACIPETPEKCTLQE